MQARSFNIRSNWLTSDHTVLTVCGPAQSLGHSFRSAAQRPHVRVSRDRSSQPATCALPAGLDSNSLPLVAGGVITGPLLSRAQQDMQPSMAAGFKSSWPGKQFLGVQYWEL